MMVQIMAYFMFISLNSVYFYMISKHDKYQVCITDEIKFWLTLKYDCICNAIHTFSAQLKKYLYYINLSSIGKNYSGQTEK